MTARNFRLALPFPWPSPPPESLMAKAATLFLFFATILALASIHVAPAAPDRPVQQQYGTPSPLHALTGIAFHVSGF